MTHTSTPSSTPSDAPGRLALLRAEMARHGVDFWLVPSSDAHQSEYVPAAWQRRAWLTSFTGSMGNAVVGLDGAWLWADSRYWLAAERELDPTAFSLMRQGQHGVPSIARFLADVGANRKVGYDPALHSPAEAKELSDAITAAGGTLVAVADNLIDAIWADRPALPAAPVEAWSETYSGKSVAAKLADLRKGTAALGCEHLVITTLDEIAWTFDIRGKDVDFNPVTIAWAIVSQDAATLFIAPSKVSHAVTAHLAAAHVTTAPYEAFDEALAALGTGRVLVDRDNGNQAILDRLASKGIRYHLARSPVMLARAKKNTTEIGGMRAAHVRDGVAVTRFLAWLDGNWRGLTEVSVADHLSSFREENERFRGLSFDTIAGYADHGAIVHYRASAATDQPLGDATLFLIDSGAQYLDGTTDITRTIHLGTPTAEEREHYTRVLKGHLALRHITFPRGTTGTHLDAFARAPLWQVGLNYGHGTGHGVGCYLSVHQGPQRVSPALNDVALEPGMVLSNEPGLYVAGRYGIRIENLCVVVDNDALSRDNPHGPFFGFDDLTMVPYCRKLIDTALITNAERAAVDAYHARVRATLLPHLGKHADHDLVRGWLQQETAPL